MSNENSAVGGLSIQAIQRMPYYLHYLKILLSEGKETISAPIIAEHFNLNEIQVRKDLAAASSAKGKPRQGFLIKELIDNMEQILGYRNVDEAVLVGAGSLGRALLTYDGFHRYGLNIVAAFDQSSELIGSEIGGKKVLPCDKISDLCRRLNIQLGVVAVPADNAQTVCDQLVAGGVRGIWNFAQVHLLVPENVLVQNENMAASLALLSKHLRETEKSEP